MNIRKNIDTNKKKFITKYEEKCTDCKYQPIIISKQYRIIVIGDVHGDFNVLTTALKMSKLINNELDWIGNNTYLVIIGDQIDSCRISNKKNPNYEQENDRADDIKILEYIVKLKKQAIQKEGNVIPLLGNHEVMNSQGDLRYVSKANFAFLDNYVDPKTNLKIKSGIEARKHSFLPNNEYGTLMGCNYESCVIIGSHLFCHAGITDSMIKDLNITSQSDLEDINIAVKMWLLGLLTDKENKYIDKILNAQDSLFWVRILGTIPPNTALSDPQCKDNISNALKILKFSSMIIGHTPQSMHKCNTNHTCSGKIWRTDNGSSYAFDGLGDIPSRRVQVLEIIDDKEYYLIDKYGRMKIDMDNDTSYYMLNKYTTIK